MFNFPPQEPRKCKLKETSYLGSSTNKGRIQPEMSKLYLRQAFSTVFDIWACLQTNDSDFSLFLQYRNYYVMESKISVCTLKKMFGSTQLLRRNRSVPYDLAIPHLGVHPRIMNCICPCKRMPSAALVIRAKNWKHPKCPTTADLGE